MKFNRLIIAVILVFFYQTSFADENAQATRAKVGMDAPAFTCHTVTGEDFSLREEKGKVILINFFATWCRPCLVELPHLEKQIYQKYKDREDFRLIVIGREHTAFELKKFMEKNRLSLPIAPDPMREIYGKYAEQTIPRSFIVGKDSKIKLVSEGYSESIIQKIDRIIRKELKK